MRKDLEDSPGRATRCEAFRSAALDAFVIDAAGQLLLAVRAYPDGFRLVGVRHTEETAVRPRLATQGTVQQLRT